MFCQVEITTKCNFKCFYCSGRKMKQMHMTDETFDSVMSRIEGVGHTINLQGEGEPTLHPRFWEFASRVKDSGNTPFVITNASHIDPEMVAETFPKIGISMDTIDADDAALIGRRLGSTMANLERICCLMGGSRVTVYVVDMGQSISGLLIYLTKLNVRIRKQRLQAKNVYAMRYSDPVEHVSCSPSKCRFVESQTMRFFSISGIEMPCCYIKDEGSYSSAVDIRSQLGEGIVPPCCSGCSEIRPMKLS